MSRAADAPRPGPGPVRGPGPARLLAPLAGLALAAAAAVLVLAPDRPPPDPDADLLCSPRDRQVRETLESLRDGVRALEELAGRSASDLDAPPPGAGPEGPARNHDPADCPA